MGWVINDRVGLFLGCWFVQKLQNHAYEVAFELTLLIPMCPSMCGLQIYIRLSYPPRPPQPPFASADLDRVVIGYQCVPEAQTCDDVPLRVALSRAFSPEFFPARDGCNPVLFKVTTHASPLQLRPTDLSPAFSPRPSLSGASQ